jgi:low temperature requirement protein LtrA
MLARAVHEPHRASTPLELFFDLIFVVAISLNAAGLHHGIAENHAAGALISYGMQFMVIWWAWMGFTWFASAFDADDVPYRLMVFVQMAGALVIAAGIPAAFERFDFSIVTVGYTIMRVGLITLWWRAGKNNPALRPATHRYIVGLIVMQLLWIAMNFAPKTWMMALFFVFILMEMAVPAWAERTVRTPAHPEHINERYSLFTIIVLGESILATVVSIKNTLGANAMSGSVLVVLVCALVIVLSLWWLYFDKPSTEHIIHGSSLLTGFLWAYGHYFIFASAAAVGVGLSIAVEFTNGSAKISEAASQWALVGPVASMLASMWIVHFSLMRHSIAVWLFPVTTALVLASALLPGIVATASAAALLTALLLATLLYQHYDAKPRVAHGG